MWLPVESKRKKFKCQISTQVYDDLCLPESRFVGDSHFPRYFRTTKAIRAGTELITNYGGSYWDFKGCGPVPAW